MAEVLSGGPLGMRPIVFEIISAHLRAAVASTDAASGKAFRVRDHLLAKASDDDRRHVRLICEGLGSRVPRSS